MDPSSQIKARRSTSGSTTIPKSAFVSITFFDISVKFSGNGSGLWGNSPVGSQNNLIHSTPSFSNNFGIKIPPVELTASSTTLNFLDLISSTLTNSKFNTSSICFSLCESSYL